MKGILFGKFNFCYFIFSSNLYLYIWVCAAARNCVARRKRPQMVHKNAQQIFVCIWVWMRFWCVHSKENSVVCFLFLFVCRSLSYAAVEMAAKKKSSDTKTFTFSVELKCITQSGIFFSLWKKYVHWAIYRWVKAHITNGHLLILFKKKNSMN